MRLTLGQVRVSDLPSSIGKCAGNIPEICSYLNPAQYRLIIAGRETGWAGGWAKIVFNLSRSNPYFSLDRHYARIINAAVCRTPIRIQNEFKEVIDPTIGLQPGTSCNSFCAPLWGYERGTGPVMLDITPTNQLVRVYYTDARDVGKNIIFTAADQNGNAIYSTVPTGDINGFMLTLATPFVTSSFQVSAITAVQKDATLGDVLVKQVDATTGTEVLLSRYGPDEVTPCYRRYYVANLPFNCCPAVLGAAEGTVQLTALAKYEHVPVTRDTDYLVIGNLEALKEECLSIRYSQMETPEARAKSKEHHKEAIKLLNQELAHYLGTQRPAINYQPMGTAELMYQGIGAMV